MGKPARQAEVLPPIERLHELFRLDGGRLYWRVGFRNATRAGSLAGCADKRTRYWEVRISGQNYRLHRVIFAMYHGYWPTLDIDHIDGDRGNNDPANLREATPLENQHNRAVGHGSTGLLGVKSLWTRRRKNGERSLRGYSYSINFEGQVIRGPRFDTPEEAHTAYLERKRVLHPAAVAPFMKKEAACGA